MNREEYIKILMYNGLTKHDAIKYYENGSPIYEDLQKNADIYITDWESCDCLYFDDDLTEEEKAEFKAEIKRKILMGEDVLSLEHIYDENGRLYYFEAYC